MSKYTCKGKGRGWVVVSLVGCGCCMGGDQVIRHIHHCHSLEHVRVFLSNPVYVNFTMERVNEFKEQ